MHGQSYQPSSYVPPNNQRMTSCPPSAMNGPMVGHMNSMANQMHNPNMINNTNGMTQSMTMNGPMSMNKSGMNASMQPMAGMTGPSGAMYGGGPRARPGPYPNQQQYLSQKRQYTNPSVQHYNTGPVMQSYGSVSQSPVSVSHYNSNQVSDHLINYKVYLTNYLCIDSILRVKECNTQSQECNQCIISNSSSSSSSNNNNNNSSSSTTIPLCKQFKPCLTLAAIKIKCSNQSNLI
jgi:hypothetical protein